MYTRGPCRQCYPGTREGAPTKGTGEAIQGGIYPPRYPPGLYRTLPGLPGTSEQCKTVLKTPSRDPQNTIRLFPLFITVGLFLPCFTPGLGVLPCFTPGLGVLPFITRFTVGLSCRSSPVSLLVFLAVLYLWAGNEAQRVPFR